MLYVSLSADVGTFANQSSVRSDDAPGTHSPLTPYLCRSETHRSFPERSMRITRPPPVKPVAHELVHVLVVARRIPVFDSLTLVFILSPLATLSWRDVSSGKS